MNIIASIILSVSIFINVLFYVESTAYEYEVHYDVPYLDLYVSRINRHTGEVAVFILPDYPESTTPRMKALSVLRVNDPKVIFNRGGEK